MAGTHTHTDFLIYYSIFFSFLFSLWVKLAAKFIDTVFGMFAKDTGQVLVTRLQHQLTQTKIPKYTHALERE